MQSYADKSSILRVQCEKVYPNLYFGFILSVALLACYAACRAPELSFYHIKFQIKDIG